MRRAFTKGKRQEEEEEDQVHQKHLEQQILITIATIAVTLAGFSGVVGIFSKELSPIKSYKLETLLFQSGVALFASLTTLIASQIGGGLESEQEFRLFWSISSWAYISITVIALIFATIDIIKTKSSMLLITKVPNAHNMHTMSRHFKKPLTTYGPNIFRLLRKAR